MTTDDRTPAQRAFEDLHAHAHELADEVIRHFVVYSPSGHRMEMWLTDAEFANLRKHGYTVEATQ